MIVLKFGGTSVANAQRIEGVRAIVAGLTKKDKKLAVVCSALGGVTDELIKMSRLASQQNDDYIERRVIEGSDGMCMVMIERTSKGRQEAAFFLQSSGNTRPILTPTNQQQSVSVVWAKKTPHTSNLKRSLVITT